jgi:hypothetical protein
MSRETSGTIEFGWREDTYVVGYSAYRGTTSSEGDDPSEINIDELILNGEPVDDEVFDEFMAECEDSAIENVLDDLTEAEERRRDGTYLNV